MDSQLAADLGSLDAPGNVAAAAAAASAIANANNQGSADANGQSLITNNALNNMFQQHQQQAQASQQHAAQALMQHRGSFSSQQGSGQATSNATAMAATSNTAGTGGSNLTEFTKRKNWSQRIIEELKDFMHVLSPTGKFMYCSPSSSELVGYSPEELVGRNITDFLHVDDIDMYVRDFNMAVRKQGDFSLYYRFRKKDDKFVIFEATGHPHFMEGSSICKCFFTMARLYPSKNTAMLDSFLELKVENERLKIKLREMMGGDGAEVSDVSNQPTPGPTGEMEDVKPIIGASPAGNMPPPATIPSRPAAPNASPIELITGLRLRDGERAQGISTGSSDALLHTDAPTTPLRVTTDIPNTPTDPNLTTTPGSAVPGTPGGEVKPRKKKKPRIEEEEYVCTDCGTVDSPEWRKGPLGPKTLCNACGLRWAKKAKKTNGSPDPDGP